MTYNKHHFFQVKFKVASEINPAIIRFKELQGDLGRWKLAVEETFNVKLGFQEGELGGKVRVFGHDFDAILDFGDYLENTFPADPQIGNYE